MKGKSPIQHLFLIALAVMAASLSGCSTQKNTAQSRWWHAFNARYNTYYNGTVAYIDGALEKEEGNRDNFTEQIPLYTVGNKNSRDLGKANFDRAIEKCEKAIHQHSIKRRPEWQPGKRKTAKDIEWLSRREYNPFLWKAWMLMGRSQFQKGDFEGAAATFAYMSRLYSTQPAIYGKARAWLAKCYIEQGWTYDAEDVIRNIQRDSIHWRAQKEWDYAFADYYIHTGDARKAIPYLRKVISHEMRHKQKARQWYLMGQLQASISNRQEAYQAFRHVIRLNPPYELEFNARIAITEVLASGNSRKMISRLKRMAASDKNKDYQDQVYLSMPSATSTSPKKIPCVPSTPTKKATGRLPEAASRRVCSCCVWAICIGKPGDMPMPSAAMEKLSACSIRTERIIRNWHIAPRCWTNWCLIPMPSPSRIPCSLLPKWTRKTETQPSTE